MQNELTKDCHTAIENMLLIQAEAQESLETVGYMEIQEGGWRRPHWFDANRFFSALPHIKMQAGYTLEYIQFPYRNGFPILVAMQPGEYPYASYEEWLAEYEAIEGKSKQTYREYRYRFTRHVELDGSAESYVEYILFRLMSNQFYLMWHSYYNDARPVCTYDDLVQATNAAIESTLVSSSDMDRFLENAADVDLSPSVSFRADIIIVKLFYFTKWGGLIQIEAQITRTFPYTVIQIEESEVISYNCGIKF